MIVQEDLKVIRVVKTTTRIVPMKNLQGIELKKRGETEWNWLGERNKVIVACWYLLGWIVKKDILFVRDLICRMKNQM